MAIFGITKQYIWIAFPLAGFALGTYLDNQETLRMTNFRDKSKLYGKPMKKGEEPSWP